MTLQQLTSFYTMITREKTGSTWFLYFSSFVANLLLITNGGFMIWTSPIIPKLISNDTSINPLKTPITTLQVSIIAGLPAIASTLGLLIMAHISNRIGRRKIMLYSGISVVCNLATIAFATHIYIYYICLAVIGFSSTGIYMNVPIYNSEIAEDGVREIMGCFLGLAIPLGILYGYIFGPLTTVRDFTLLILIPATIHVVFSFALVESPIYLAFKGRKSEALRALEKLRKNNNDKLIEAEYCFIQETVHSNVTKNVSIIDVYNNRAFRKAMLISMVMVNTQQISGISSVLSFMASIFNEAGTGLSGNAVGILVGSVKVLFFLLTTSIVRKFGRRQLLLISSCICAFSMFILGVYFYLKHNESPLVPKICYLPVIFIVVFVFGYSLGLGPIPIALVGELFPVHLKPIGLATVMIVENFFIFLIMFSFPLLSEAYGFYTCMGTHCVGTLLGFLLMFFYLPDTRGKSLLEIQQILGDE